MMARPSGLEDAVSERCQARGRSTARGRGDGLLSGGLGCYSRCEGNVASGRRYGGGTHQAFYADADIGIKGLAVDGRFDGLALGRIHVR
jgi:hypothetical protein